MKNRPDSDGENATPAMPLVTIGVTTYNRPEMLRQCIVSILEQSYRNFEVIIGNDFVEVPVTFASLGLAPDPRIRIVNHQQNIGAYANNHYLAKAATGKLFTWLADDDLMHPEFLEIACEALSRYDIVAVFSNYSAASDPEGIFPERESLTSPRIYSGVRFIDEYTHRRLKTIGSYGIFTRAVFTRFADVPRFGVGLPVYGDTFMPILAASMGDIGYLDQKLLFLRTHENSNSIRENAIETYSSAQKDFLVEFEKLCRNTTLSNNYEEQLESLLKWFAEDGWAVVCRKDDSVCRRISGYYQYVVNLIAPNIPVRFRTGFYLFLVRLVFGNSIRYLASRTLKGGRK